MKRWSEAQIEAMLELDGLGQRIVSPDELAEMHEQDAPAVKRGCICPNGHKPDESGLIFTSPSCELHGCRSRFVVMSRLTQGSARTPGVVHGRKSGK